ncbi:BaiN/RdsA family NAD(P)/FAD-dependent oxidoreductase [Paracoccus aminophilus]|uniref:Flavoprotein n=1 Tax=Paracoccus aminophilus JCM 7686 TaxID=1367847 RepID=S5YTQ3_PARAH|nr:NAD(P)/FAD-dependent oxidoreductase [Paracoccus aminophilus]AGT08586.1 hypothetical protein JCM7686_1485 [Paracoccus aminophilus JCM 7686]
MDHVDIAILGAGAAGLFCAGSLAGSGRRVLVLDHARAPGEKIRISGGGRCNFTNLATSYDRFLSSTPRFAASALAGYRPRDFVDLVDRAGIAWHEKTLGQLFCDGSAKEIVSLLLDRMRGTELRLGVSVTGLRQDGGRFVVETSAGPVSASQVIVATGGKSIPKMGATGIGYELAKSFGHHLIEPRPGLVPLTFAEQDLDLSRPLAGVALDAVTSHGSGKSATRFADAVLFTHRGLSGPAILQISSFWQPGDELRVDLFPKGDLAALLREARGQGGRVQLRTTLARWLPARLADAVAVELGLAEARLADQGNPVLDRVAARISDWRLKPVGSEGWRTAEVTVGGVSCAEIHAKTMESRLQPGLYFIGEVVDVTGWLGGYNFQWAWASAEAAAQAIVKAP